MITLEQIDHKAYPESLKVKTSDSLRYIIKDCQECLKINPSGNKAGYYADEIHYCIAELNWRKNVLA